MFYVMSRMHTTIVLDFTCQLIEGEVEFVQNAPLAQLSWDATCSKIKRSKQTSTRKGPCFSSLPILKLYTGHRAIQNERAPRMIMGDLLSRYTNSTYSWETKHGCQNWRRHGHSDSHVLELQAGHSNWTLMSSRTCIWCAFVTNNAHFPS